MSFEDCQRLTLTGFHSFLQDKLMTAQSDSSSSGGSSGNWLFKNKEHGKASATASLVFFQSLTFLLDE